MFRAWTKKAYEFIMLLTKGYLHDVKRIDEKFGRFVAFFKRCIWLISKMQTGSPSLWLTPQMTVLARAWAGCRQDPGTWKCIQVSPEAQLLSLLSQHISRATGPKMEQLERCWWLYATVAQPRAPRWWSVPVTGSWEFFLSSKFKETFS